MPKRPFKKFSANSMDSAVEEMENGGNLRITAKKFGVPRSSLLRKWKFPDFKESFGPSPILSEKEENQMVDWIFAMTEKKIPIKRQDLKESVKGVLLDHPRKNPFKNNYPGPGWVRAFLKRHPHIDSQKRESINLISTTRSKSNVCSWFEDIDCYLRSHELQEVIADAGRIFHGDITEFSICQTTGLVLSLKKKETVHAVDTANANLTVMMAFSASGIITPPMVVYPKKTIPKKVSLGMSDGWGVGISENGWLTADVFYQYLANVFHTSLVKQKIKFPVILFVDGLKTPVTFKISQLCSERNIELIALYPYAATFLRLSDRAAFQPIKSGWKKAVRDWRKSNSFAPITKLNFAAVLAYNLKTVVKRTTFGNGFRACGLYPFDPNSINCLKYCKVKNHNTVEPELSSKKAKLLTKQENKSDDEVCQEKLNPQSFSHSLPPTCVMCKNCFMDNLISCDECSKAFHKGCVPHHHNLHIPVDKEVDLFICHFCFVVDSD